MTTDVQGIPGLALDEADGIVEAERIRLTQDWDQWEQELAGFLAELPAPPSLPPRSYTPAVDHLPAALSPLRRSARCPPRRSPAPTLWATQRSPPGGHTRTHHPKMFAHKRSDALTGDQAMTRAGPQQYRPLRDTTHHRPTICVHTATDRGTTQVGRARCHCPAAGAALAHRRLVRPQRVLRGHRSSAVLAAFGFNGPHDRPQLRGATCVTHVGAKHT
jgi:hypothetical protein